MQLKDAELEKGCRIYVSKKGKLSDSDGGFLKVEHVCERLKYIPIYLIALIDISAFRH